MKAKPSEQHPGLIRALGPFTAMAIVIGTVIGSGVFVKPRQVAEHVPGFGLVAAVWVLGGLLAILGALALSEVAVLYPRAGGNYVYLREGFGRLAGFLFGWVEFWMIRAGSLAALATIFAKSLHNVLGNDALRAAVALEVNRKPLSFWGEIWLTVGVMLGLAVVNVLGVRWGGLLQLFITMVKVASLLAILVLPFLVNLLASPDATIARPDAANLTPLWPADWGAVHWGGIGTALVGVLFAYHGWMNVAPVAGEVKRPQRNMPVALVGGTACIIFLYLGANLAYALVIPQSEMAGMADPPVATVFSARLLGPLGAAAAATALMFSTFGALNGNLLVGPRVLFAMGEDQLAPRWLAVVHARFHTPALAILVMAGWAGLLVLLVALGIRNGYLKEDANHFDVLTTFAMFGAVMFETLAVATIFVFRRRQPEAERPYRCPAYPLVPALYVAIMAVVLVNMFVEKWMESLIGVGFIVLGVGVYWLFIVRKARRAPDSAT